MTKTEQNLLEAFAGESQANRKYLAFAKQADKEGYSRVAKLFRAAAEAETIHAHAHLRALGGIRNTDENLKEAHAGETHEFRNMYPGMIETAREEGNKAAERSFSYANAVEKVHMPTSIRMPWITWIDLRTLTATTYALYAVSRARQKPLRNARFVAPCPRPF